MTTTEPKSAARPADPAGPMSANDLLAEAKQGIVTIAPEDARTRGTILDVREAGELSSDGAIPDAVHVPRGMLEFRADPGGEKCHEALATAHRENRRINVLCASGSRAVLAAFTLQRMGYSACVIDGGLGGWKDAGLPVKHDD